MRNSSMAAAVFPESGGLCAFEQRPRSAGRTASSMTMASSETSSIPTRFLRRASRLIGTIRALTCQETRHPKLNPRGLLALCLTFVGTGLTLPLAAESLPFSVERSTNATVHVVIVEDATATEAYRPHPDHVQSHDGTRHHADHRRNQFPRRLAQSGHHAGCHRPESLFKPGPNSGTRPAVVSAVAQGLIAAGVPAQNLIIWDRDEVDLREAGFTILPKNSKSASRRQRRWDETIITILPDRQSGLWRSRVREEGRRHRAKPLFQTASAGATKIINITPL